MASLTAKRFEKAKPVFDKYKAKLLAKHELDFPGFKMELKAVLNMGYQELKSMIMDLSKKPEYELLAVSYMEEGTPGVASEFKITLAEFYGMDYYDTSISEREAKKKAYWAKAFPKK